MDLAVAAGHDGAAAGGWLAVPGRNNAACVLDDRDQRRDVVGFQAGLDDHVDEAGGEQAVIVAVAAKSGEACLCADTFKCVFPAVEQVRRRGCQDRVRKIDAGSRP